MSRLPYDEEGSWRKRFISSIDFENIYARFPHWKLDDGFYLARFSMMLSSFDVEACINFAERALPIIKAILARDPAKGFHETDDLWKRSEERSVGTEGFRLCNCRGSPDY